MSRASGLLRTLARWHRLLGLAAAVFVLWLAISGLAMNHASLLGLDLRHVQGIWLLDHYGVQAARPTASFAVGQQWLSQVENELYLDNQRVTAMDGRLLGAVRLGQAIVAVTPNRLLVLNEQGGLQETLGPEHGVPRNLEAAGTKAGRLILRHSRGIVRLDPASLQAGPVAAAGTTWSTPQALPEPVGRALETSVRRNSISYDRLLRDLHSGRFFGSGGRLVIDAVAVILIVLSFPPNFTFQR